MGRIEHPGGLVEIGAGSGFHFDNEAPRHQAFLQPFELGDRLVTNGEYLAFIQDDGYSRAELWLSDGWTQVQAEAWRAPMYWRQVEGQWFEYTLAGLHPLDEANPVVHISGYEADAFARWSGARLPTEVEWEVVAAQQERVGNFDEDEVLHPVASDGCSQFFGDAWEWTSSAYGPYPGYRPLPGKLGEYNGKFMANQLVLRGGSCATPRDHIRASYRNFFYPPDRWQFSGVRLAFHG